jgi:3D (Asp-Asp-Asp) domain-containing protein
MRIISIVLLSVVLLGANPVQAQVENANINTKFELKDSLTKIVSFLTKSAAPEIAEAQSPAEPEPEVIIAEEPKTPEEIKYEAIMARWKKKQAHMKAPQGKFIINASAYTAAADECGKNDGITSSGVKVKENQTLACPPNFAFGTKIRIEGMGVRICEDRGGAIKGNHIDIYMETKAEAFKFGRRNLEAEVVL